MTLTKKVNTSKRAKTTYSKAKNAGLKKDGFDPKKAAGALAALPLNFADFRPDKRRAFLREHAPEIAKLLAAGWTPTTLAKALQDQGVPVTPEMIKAAMEAYAEITEALAIGEPSTGQAGNAESAVVEKSAEDESVSPQSASAPTRPTVTRVVRASSAHGRAEIAQENSSADSELCPDAEWESK